jgi:hypothetical protein
MQWQCQDVFPSRILNNPACIGVPELYVVVEGVNGSNAFEIVPPGDAHLDGAHRQTQNRKTGGR